MNPIKKVPKNNPNNPNHESGFNCSVLHEPNNDFKHDAAGCETVYQGQNNSWIILGRDRPGSKSSGYGHKGHGKDSMIDIVVGRLSAVDATKIKGKINPNPFADAARLYLSQKSDIDSTYNLAAGKTGKSAARSVALLKADDVRIVSRNSLKLITKSDAFTSTNNRITNTCGVELIANNDDTDMQPIPKGDNLVSALNAILENVLELNGIVQGFMEIQRDFNRAITQHTHPSPFYGIRTILSPELLVAGKSAEASINLKVESSINGNITSIFNTRKDYVLSVGKKYINSAYHFLN